MEKDDQVKGKGNSYDFGARNYSSRIGTFTAIDPLIKDFPSQSGYSFAGNNPIKNIDVNGEFYYDASSKEAYEDKYPMITKYLSSNILDDVLGSDKIMNALTSYNENFTKEDVKTIFTWSEKTSRNGMMPDISFVESPGGIVGQGSSAGYYSSLDGGSNTIEINVKYAEYLEKILANENNEYTEEEQLVALTRFYMTIIHEVGHFQEYVGAPDIVGGKLRTEKQISEIGEYGYHLEQKIWGSDTYKPYDDVVLADPDADEYDGDYVCPPIKAYDYRVGVVEGVDKEAKKTEEGKATLPTVPNSD